MEIGSSDSDTWKASKYRKIMKKLGNLENEVNALTMSLPKLESDLISVKEHSDAHELSYADILKGSKLAMDIMRELTFMKCELNGKLSLLAFVAEDGEESTNAEECMEKCDVLRIRIVQLHDRIEELISHTSVSGNILEMRGTGLVTDIISNARMMQTAFKSATPTQSPRPKPEDIKQSVDAAVNPVILQLNTLLKVVESFKKETRNQFENVKKDLSNHITDCTMNIGEDMLKAGSVSPLAGRALGSSSSIVVSDGGVTPPLHPMVVGIDESKVNALIKDMETNLETKLLASINTLRAKIDDISNQVGDQVRPLPTKNDSISMNPASLLASLKDSKAQSTRGSMSWMRGTSSSNLNPQFSSSSDLHKDPSGKSEYHKLFEALETERKRIEVLVQFKAELESVAPRVSKLESVHDSTVEMIETMDISHRKDRHELHELGKKFDEREVTLADDILQMRKDLEKFVDSKLSNAMSMKANEAVGSSFTTKALCLGCGRNCLVPTRPKSQYNNARVGSPNGFVVKSSDNAADDMTDVSGFNEQDHLMPLPIVTGKGDDFLVDSPTGDRDSQYNAYTLPLNHPAVNRQVNRNINGEQSVAREVLQSTVNVYSVDNGRPHTGDYVRPSASRGIVRITTTTSNNSVENSSGGAVHIPTGRNRSSTPPGRGSIYYTDDEPSSQVNPQILRPRKCDKAVVTYGQDRFELTSLELSQSLPILQVNSSTIGTNALKSVFKPGSSGKGRSRR